MATKTFVIRGIPCSKARPRFARIKTKTGREFVTARDPKQKQADDVRIILQQKAPYKPYEKPIEVCIEAYFPIVKSTPLKNIPLMLSGKIKHTKKPDVDNILKFYLDCMNGIVYYDDRQIAYTTILKTYSKTPLVKIYVTEFDDD